MNGISQHSFISDHSANRIQVSNGNNIPKSFIVTKIEDMKHYIILVFVFIFIDIETTIKIFTNSFL